MEAVQPGTNSYPYDQRERLDAYLAAICVSPNGNHYYRTVVRPNLLPEITPNELPSNVYWIGQKQKDTIRHSRQAFADMLVWLVEMEDMQADDAAACAELLDLPCFRTDADILPFKTLQLSPVEPPRQAHATSELINLAAFRQDMYPAQPEKQATVLAFPLQPATNTVPEIGDATVLELFTPPASELAQLYDFTYSTSISPT